MSMLRTIKRQIAKSLVMIWLESSENSQAPESNTLFFYPHHFDALFDFLDWDLDQRVEVRMRLVNRPNWDDGAIGPDEIDEEKQ